MSDTKTYRRNISACILSFLDKRNLPQRTFADLCGISTVTLWQIISEKKDAKLVTLFKISSEIGITVPELLSGGKAVDDGEI